MYLDSKTEITVDLTPEEVNELKRLYDQHVTGDCIFGQLHIVVGAANDGDDHIVMYLRIYGEDANGKDVQKSFEFTA